MRFENHHPGILFLYFLSAIAGSVCFNHPVFLVLSFLTSFICSAYFGKQKRIIWNLFYIPLIFCFTWYYAAGNHFGVTIVRENVAGNYITVESIVYGLSIGIRGASVLMWLSVVHRILTMDKVVYLFGRVSPKLSLYIAVLARLVPRLKEKAVQTKEAQHCIGMGIQTGNPVSRMKHGIRIVRTVFHFMLEHLKDSSDSMKSRGYSLKGRTAFSIFRFDMRDRTLVIWISILNTIVWSGQALEQNTILYNPVIIIHKITSWSFVFYSAYLGLGFLPVLIELYGNIKRKIQN